MSSFVLSPEPVEPPAHQPQPQQRKLLHRTSDPELSEHDLDGAWMAMELTVARMS